MRSEPSVSLRWSKASSLALVAFLALQACSGGGGAGEWSAASRELGLGPRLDRAPDPAAAACSRADSLAGTVLEEIEGIDEASPGFAGSFEAFFPSWVESFGPFHGLLYGEIRRCRDLFAADEEVDPVELNFLALALGEHGRFAGVGLDERKSLGLLIGNLGAREVDRRVLFEAGDLVVNVGHLLSSLERCSPRSAGASGDRR